MKSPCRVLICGLIVIAMIVAVFVGLSRSDIENSPMTTSGSIPVRRSGGPLVVMGDGGRVTSSRHAVLPNTIYSTAVISVLNTADVAVRVLDWESVDRDGLDVTGVHLLPYHPGFSPFSPVEGLDDQVHPGELLDIASHPIIPPARTTNTKDPVVGAEFWIMFEIRLAPDRNGGHLNGGRITYEVDNTTYTLDVPQAIELCVSAALCPSVTTTTAEISAHAPS